MADFAGVIQTWNVFYFAVAAVAGTLLGLLFVAISLNISALRQPKLADLRCMSNQTYVNYLLIMLSSLVFLFPNQTPAGIGLPLLLAGTAGLALTLNQFRQFQRNADHPILSAYFHKPLFILQISLISLICFTAVAVCALLILLQQQFALYLFTLPIFVLIIAATQTTWDFLTHH